MRHFTFILVLFSFLNSYSQENKKIIYRESDGTLMTESEYLALKEEFRKKMKVEGEKGEIRETIEDSIVKNKVYKNFQLSFVSTTVTTIKERIETYLNRKFPPYKLNALDSQEFNLSQLEGKPTFITFWFTRCAPCIKELPALRDLKSKYEGKVNFVAITFDNQEEVKSFLGKREFNYTHIVGAQEFINDIGLNTYPKNIFLDKNGIVKKIKNEIPYKMKIKNNVQVLEFDLSEYERQLENLL